MSLMHYKLARQQSGLNEFGAILDKTNVTDVDRDGDADLVVTFQTAQTGIACEDIEASLVIETFAGESFMGIDSIEVTGCK